MSNIVKEFRKRIEDLRQQLEKLVLTKGTTDPEVLKASRELDKVLNDYHRLMHR